MYRSMFPRDIFDELDRLQREVQRAFEIEPSIRGVSRGGFPALNIGYNNDSIEVYAFAPGLNPDKIEVTVERGVLTIAGERQDDLASSEPRATVHIHERFSGQFRRVMSLPDDADPNEVSADYRDGVLHVSIKRRASSQPRRISVH